MPDLRRELDPIAEGASLNYRLWVWRLGDDPHWELVGSAAELDEAIDMATSWAEGGVEIRVDRTIWYRPAAPLPTA